MAVSQRILAHLPVFRSGDESLTVQIRVQGVSTTAGLMAMPMLGSSKFQDVKGYLIGKIEMTLGELLAKQREAQGQ